MLTFIIIFALILFLYVHLLFHWKVSNDIDIPHIITHDKDKLESVADMRQPFIFEKSIDSSLHLEGNEIQINIRKMKESPIKVPHKGMLSAVKKEPYISENNGYFLKELNWNKEWNDLDTYLKPHMNFSCAHDILYGNQNVTTKLRHSMNYRNYFCVLEGNIELKLLPPSSSEILAKKGSLESSIDVWTPSESDSKELSNTSIILIPLKKGSIIHIPAYWWYSIRMPEFSSVLLLSYSTYMNSISQIPHKIKRFITQQKIEL